MPATAEQVKVHSFYSRGRNEKIIRRPLTMAATAMGQQVKLQDRVAYDFAPNGRLELREGQDGLPDGPIDPATGERTVQDALTWITAGYMDAHGHFGPHPGLNVRFWHEGHEPDRPLPTENDFLELLTGHVIALEVAPIEVLLAQERETHNRAVLVQAAERALAQVTATREEMDKAAADFVAPTKAAKEKPPPAA